MLFPVLKASMGLHGSELLLSLLIFLEGKDVSSHSDVKQSTWALEFETLCRVFQRSCTSIPDPTISLSHTLSGKGKTDGVCLICSSLVHSEDSGQRCTHVLRVSLGC